MNGRFAIRRTEIIEFAIAPWVLLWLINIAITVLAI
jgi:hypothetical protein